MWDVPGGFLEEGEHPLDGLRRELREETGLEVEPVRFVGVWMDVYGDAPDARRHAEPLLEVARRGRRAGRRRRRRRARLVPTATSSRRRDELAFTSVADALDRLARGHTEPRAELTRPDDEARPWPGLVRGEGCRRGS